MAHKSLEQFSEEISYLPIGDPGYEAGMLMLLESRYKLSAAYTSLTIRKAKAGVIGISWYKQDEQS